MTVINIGPRSLIIAGHIGMTSCITAIRIGLKSLLDDARV